jgi:hypothetical protein
VFVATRVMALHEFAIRTCYIRNIRLARASTG